MLSPKSFFLLVAGALALGLCAPQNVLAQPDPNNAPKADNPNNRPARPNKPRGQMTPEEREAAIKNYLRAQIERTGLTDVAQQDAAIVYIQDELDARQNLQESSRELSIALRNKTLSDAQFAGLLNTYMGEVEDEKTRRTAAQKKLSETIDMLKTPRLEAMLALMGLWNDAPAVMNNMWMGRNRDNRDNRDNKPNKQEKPNKKADAA